MNGEPLLIVAGGTTESREAAVALVAQGYRVLWSQATDTPFQLKEHSRLHRRSGRLSARGWEVLVRETGAAAIVDAGHPFACELRETLRQLSARLGVPLLRLRRAATRLDASAVVVKSHAEAARKACELGQRILVTVGTRHLSHYLAAARGADVALFARVLEGPESREGLAVLGCDLGRILFGRGPFDVAQNLLHLRQCNADVLVTKDSGEAGGLGEKLEAARQLGCRVLVVARPEESADALESVAALLQRLRRMKL